MQALLGVTLAAVVAYGAYRTRSLDRSGAIAAILVGSVIFGAGGWQWAVLLLAFFISSSLLTRAHRDRKRAVNQDYAKAGARDAGQVLANGGLPALFAVLHSFFPEQPWAWIGFAASLAAATADTWATELGVLSHRKPRLITTFRLVEPGSSGGISLVGSLAALAGAALIGLLAVLFTFRLQASVFSRQLSPAIDDWTLFTDYWLLITVAGLLGSLFDSLLGATVQAMYWCPTDQKETERHPLHTCGTPTTLLRGWPWLGNDWVNLACASFGAAVALAGFAGLTL